MGNDRPFEKIGGRGTGGMILSYGDVKVNCNPVTRNVVESVKI